MCIDASTGQISKFVHLISHPYFSDLACTWQPVDVSEDMKQVRAIGLNFRFNASYFSSFYEDLTRVFSTSTTNCCRKEKVIERIYSTADGIHRTNKNHRVPFIRGKKSLGRHSRTYNCPYLSLTCCLKTLGLMMTRQEIPDSAFFGLFSV